MTALVCWCAWCRVLISGPISSVPARGDSHGICAACQARLEAA